MVTIFPLAFPYAILSPDTARLSRLSITNADDSERYQAQITETNCSSISKISTQTRERLPGPLKYVSNDSAAYPLLLSVPGQFNRCKLHLQFAKKTLHSEHSLVILKTLGDDTNTDHLREYLLQDDLESKSREVSEIAFSKFEPDSSYGDNYDIIVNDIYDPAKFSNGRINYYLWEYDSTRRHHSLLLNFSFWVESVEATEELRSPPQPSRDKALPCPPGEDDSIFTLSEFKRAFVFSTVDGPEFRGCLTGYEKNIPKLRKAIHALLEDASYMESTFRKIISSKRSVIDTLDILVDSQFNPLLHRLDLPRSFQKNLLTFFESIEKRMTFILRDVLNSTLLSKMLTYLSDVTPHEGAETSPAKKTFEKNSKEYYDWLNKYLSNEKDRPESKLLVKRKNFELSKFDYLNALNLASNNQYFNQFLENVLKFSSVNFKNQRFDIKEFKMNQSLLNNDASVYLNTMSRFNSEKLQYRQMIEACANNEELSEVVKMNPLNPSKEMLESEGAVHGIMSSAKVDLVFSSAPGQRSVPTLGFHQNTTPSILIDDQNSEISGILYALGGKGKPGWHKEWVVLRDGQLKEYSDWRKGKSLINKPIDIALASVKPITYDKRQFCFEIMTSKGQKHVFQAINDDDRDKWIRALYNAGQITQKLLADDKKRKSSKPNLHLEKPSYLGDDNDDEKQGSPVSIISNSLASTDPKEIDYLRAVHSLPQSLNNYCADCSSTKSVEWISLTFLVTLCVKCSSCHRSLGSHVTKVKSLKLDNFENENRVLLNYINNSRVNSYLSDEKRKIHPEVDNDTRLSFIKDKYVNRSFVDRSINFDELLVTAVRKIDIANVIKALNCGGNPNLPLQMGSSNANFPPITINIFEYSLRKLVEVDEEGTVREYFVISELLLHHGCNIDKIHELNVALNHTDEAKGYWNEKKLRLK
ncbi:hypothetical protein FT663_02689 [Candidozyma haemuli var. vulneris]|uniref:ADP-ribosylation factor GTPase-activating protein n=1 Tax=Candidozyma haemuli TaxID=45357 RepID=A0A2V1AZ91_9ASCO|nr:hypothetical protein CXQ85_002540 [[Candida] haemuloni]KAF3987730.1 hypothetical protein FT662_03803 [[Candida] haemuloni var. vulneris]KAF3991503.1 hypothetical protein FT663_02689 [[Candida] haemuloni var. vulneris]PVH22816.1 hypothetical protein CXQ85_002540 [[Candida] haemuloni]